MHYNVLGYHLCGDLLKIDTKNYGVVDSIHNELLKKNMVTNDLDKFIKHAKSIIIRENERERERLFLL